MATSAQMQSVAQLLRAFSLRDVETMVSRMTEDVELRASALISGKGDYSGREGAREGFEQMERELDARRERVRITPLRWFSDASHDDKILVLAEVTITRETGDRYTTETAYLYTMEGDLVAELATWLDHDEGLRQLEQPVELKVP